MRNDRREIMLGSTLLVGALVSVAVLPRRGSASRRKPVAIGAAVPEAIGAWRSNRVEAMVLPQNDAVSSRFYQELVARNYHAFGMPTITMLIAYGAEQTGALQLHRPESCYPAYGYTLGPSREVGVPLKDGRTIAGTTLTATRDGVSDQLLFWTRIGQDFPTTAWQGRMRVIRAAMYGQAPDGVLVRLSVPMTDPIAAQTLLATFARDLVDAMQAHDRHLLAGGA